MFKAGLAAAMLIFVPAMSMAAEGPNGRFSDLEGERFSSPVSDGMDSWSTLTGTCGASEVTYNSIRDTDGERYPWARSDGSTKLTVKSPGGSASFPDPKGTPDHNVGNGPVLLACVMTPTGKKLLVRAGCNASSCAPEHYLVIDPASARVLTRPIQDINPCDVRCAEKSLGAKMPGWMHFDF